MNQEKASRRGTAGKSGTRGTQILSTNGTNGNGNTEAVIPQNKRIANLKENRARLDPQCLHTSFNPERVPFASSEDIPLPGRAILPQPRALEALELALNINSSGYNVYLSGEPNLGRRYMLRDFLSARVKKMPSPPDLIYLHNFTDADRPVLYRISSGQGIKFKQALSKAMSRIRKELSASVERHNYVRRRGAIYTRFANARSDVLQEMEGLADAQGFKLDMDDTGSMTLFPLKDGKRLDDEAFEEAPQAFKNRIKKKGEALVRSMHPFLRKLNKMEQDLEQEERELERKTATDLLDTILTPLAEKFKSICLDAYPAEYFSGLREDILENLDVFFAPENAQAQSPYPLGPGHEAQGYDEISHRYEVNLFVDNSQTNGAPVIFEDHPTPQNLLGCIERESELGNLVTNFSLIKAGALHRANGGFLILQAEEVLQHLSSWEGMLRALRAGVARLDDLGDGDAPKSKGISPSPVPLSLKVILIGGEELYEILLFNDPRFSKMFKIKAQMTGRMPRNAKNIRLYLGQARRIVEENNLMHFSRSALAGLIDFGSLLLEDQDRISLEFPLLRELMIEASAYASMNGGRLVEAEHLQKALDSRTYRLNLVEEAYMEEYDSQLIKVKTSGQAIGCINGLSVTDYGGFEFGLPHQIACTVGVGSGGIIDLERESKMGGPIHTKASMIIKSYLVSMFARKHPLILSGSICFEQSYAGIEGDSASGAELAALLSALAQVPIDMGLAFTGAVSQSGQIMAVGGVSRKVEGFFEVCRRHGLSGLQGVILPRDNVRHLMLKDDVVEAVEQGLFNIYQVGHISEAMELLTGMPSGVMRKDGTFTPGSIYARADRRLAELTRLAVKTGKGAY